MKRMIPFSHVTESCSRKLNSHQLVDILIEWDLLSIERNPQSLNAVKMEAFAGKLSALFGLAATISLELVRRNWQYFQQNCNGTCGSLFLWGCRPLPVSNGYLEFLVGKNRWRGASDISHIIRPSLKKRHLNVPLEFDSDEFEFRVSCVCIFLFFVKGSKRRRQFPLKV